MNFIFRHFRKIVVVAAAIDIACVLGLIYAAIHFIHKAW